METSSEGLGNREEGVPDRTEGQIWTYVLEGIARTFAVESPESHPHRGRLGGPKYRTSRQDETINLEDGRERVTLTVVSRKQLTLTL